MNKYSISDAQYAAIKAAFDATRDTLIRRRLTVLMMRHEGRSADEIAEAVGINRSTVYLILNRYQEFGLERFTQNNYLRNAQRPLDEAQERQIMDALAKRAEAEPLTAETVRQAVEEALGRPAAMRYVLKLLNRYGWRKIKLTAKGESRKPRVFWIPRAMSRSILLTERDW